jgi:hypothetical protein
LRELQRLHLLKQGVAIPPTAILDSYWQRNGAYRAEILQIAKSLDMSVKHFNFLLTEVIPWQAWKTRNASLPEV